MTDWGTAADDYLAELSRRPAARAPASVGEVWSSEWNRSGLDTLTGIGKPLDDAYADLVKGVEGAAGRPVADFVPGLADAATADERARLIRGAIADLPEEKRAALEPLFDIRRRASEKAHKTENDANDVYSAAYGLSGVGTSWAAGIARQAVDPVNLATLPLGGPLKGPLAKVLLREAGIGALTQLAQEPAIEAGRAELGLDAGFARGAGNVAQAAVGAAGLTALFRAGAFGLRAARGERAAEGAGAFSGDRTGMDSGGVQNNAPADSAGPILLPEDLAAAAHVAERDQMLDLPRSFRIPAAWPTIMPGSKARARHSMPARKSASGRPPRPICCRRWRRPARGSRRSSSDCPNCSLARSPAGMRRFRRTPWPRGARWICKPKRLPNAK
jgi:hypothetical protein